jgi:hypothetical protein
MTNYLGLPEVINTWYPQTTHLATPTPRWEPRKFQVLGVRDLVQDPLSVAEYLRRPMTRRSRYLIRVLDLDKRRFRSVYQRSMSDWYRETPLRIGIYEGSTLVDMTNHNWGPTLADRKSLIRFLAKFDGLDMGEFRLGIFSDDLEVITCDSLS